MYSSKAPANASGPRPPTPDRRFALRAATGEAHQRVESIVGSAGMFETVHGYGRYLQATLELRTELEARLDRAGAHAIWPGWQQQKLVSLLRLDLADVGIQPRYRPDPPSELLTTGELLATLYVLVGSALGARVLVRSVRELGFSESHGARHLYAQAAETGAWREFVGVLEASAIAPCHATACAVFERFAAAYEEAAC